jgi:hypothetical protein
MDDVDGRAGGVGKVDDFLGAHVPSPSDTFSLELGGVDDGSTQLHVELSGEFPASFVVDPCSHFCLVIDLIFMIDHCRSCRKRE